MVTLGSTSLTIVGVVAAIAVVCLFYAVVLRRQVLAAGEGTRKMQTIAHPEKPAENKGHISASNGK